MTNQSNTTTSRPTRKPRQAAPAPADPPTGYFAFFEGFKTRHPVERLLPLKGFLTEGEIASAVDLARRLDELLERFSASQAYDRFLAEADTWAERLDRWALLRIIVALELGPLIELAWPGWLPPDPTIRERPFRPLELQAIILTAANMAPETMAIPTVLVAVLGADPGEYGRIMPNDVVDGDDDQPRQLLLPGEDPVDRRPGRTGVEARTVDIDPWARPELARYLDRARIQPDIPLLDARGVVRTLNVNAAAGMRLAKVLRYTGYHWDPSAKPLSIRHGVLRRFWETHGTDAALEFSGWADPSVLFTAIGELPRKPVRRRTPLG